MSDYGYRQHQKAKDTEPCSHVSGLYSLRLCSKNLPEASTPVPEYRLHVRMEQSATTGLMATGMESPIEEIQDFDRVVEAYQPAIFRFILASLRDRDAAETLTQDCFLRAYRHRNRFRGSASVKTWLMQIAVNLVRDRTRNRRFQFWRRTQLSAVDACLLEDCVVNRGLSPEAQALVNDQVRGIWQAARTLSDMQRSVFLLRFVEEMDLLEIADVLGVKEGTVKSHLSRALNNIREHMRKVE
jgi:RNA polymerase sigma-70 factor (ECF subfamily)